MGNDAIRRMYEANEAILLDDIGEKNIHDVLMAIASKKSPYRSLIGTETGLFSDSVPPDIQKRVRAAITAHLREEYNKGFSAVQALSLSMFREFNDFFGMQETSLPTALDSFMAYFSVLPRHVAKTLTEIGNELAQREIPYFGHSREQLHEFTVVLPLLVKYANRDRRLTDEADAVQISEYLRIKSQQNEEFPDEISGEFDSNLETLHRLGTPFSNYCHNNFNTALDLMETLDHRSGDSEIPTLDSFVLDLRTMVREYSEPMLADTHTPDDYSASLLLLEDFIRQSLTEPGFETYSPLFRVLETMQDIRLNEPFLFQKIVDFSAKQGLSIFQTLEIAQHHHYFVDFPDKEKPEKLVSLEHELASYKFRPEGQIHPEDPVRIFTSPDVLTKKEVYVPDGNSVFSIFCRGKNWERLGSKIMRDWLYTVVTDEYERRVGDKETISADRKEELMEIINDLFDTPDQKMAEEVFNHILKLPSFAASDTWGNRIFVDSYKTILFFESHLRDNYERNFEKVPKAIQTVGGQLLTRTIFELDKPEKFKDGPFKDLYVFSFDGEEYLNDDKHGFVRALMALPQPTGPNIVFELQLTNLKIFYHDYIDSTKRHTRYEVERDRFHGSLQEAIIESTYGEDYRTMRSVCPDNI